MPNDPRPRAQTSMLLFAATIFLGAFLLFEVEPLIARYILPWFGGGPAVWTTCLVFFQLLLLAGYAYAHALAAWVSPRGQSVIHAAVLVGSVVLLPIVPSVTWKPPDAEIPALRILLLLSRCVGLPYFALSATGPLLQAWAARASSGRSPYRLYALSNIASLLALLSYPFVIEPTSSRHTQAIAWSVAMGVFAVICAGCAWIAAKSPAIAIQNESDSVMSAPRNPRGVTLLWFAFSAIGSTLLLATTNRLSQEVAAVPFLWVLPLSIYLLSFVICFMGPRAYPAGLFRGLLPVAIAVACGLLLSGGAIPLRLQIIAYGGVLFVCCVVCHGELYRLRPTPSRLTAFYLTVAVGGAAGGVFVAVLAPLCFSDYHEFPWALIGCGVLTLLAIFLDPASRLYRGRHPWAYSFIAAGLLVVGYALYVAAMLPPRGMTRLAQWRNFYGVLSVYRNESSSTGERRMLRHGRIMHGEQFQDAARRDLATTYFTSHSGIGRAIEAMPAGPRRIGVIGLGAGTLAAYGRAGDAVRYYEIDPAVEHVAREWFTFLKDCKADLSVTLGDGRLSLDREATANQLPPFDLLVIDAFSGDAIPVHLLTTECFAIYDRRLATGGLLALHITNRNVDLEPVVRRLADFFGWSGVVIDDPIQDQATSRMPSTWVILARKPELLDVAGLRDGKPLRAGSDLPRWTDERADLFRVLK